MCNFLTLDEGQRHSVLIGYNMDAGHRRSPLIGNSIYEGHRHSLLIGYNIDAGVVEGGGLGEQWGDDSHGGRDGFRVSKRGPQTHNGVWRPCHQEHDDHHYGHLQ